MKRCCRKGPEMRSVGSNDAIGDYYSVKHDRVPQKSLAKCVASAILRTARLPRTPQMCGRFTLTVPSYEQLTTLLGVETQSQQVRRYRPRYNVAPRDVHWILLSADDRRRLIPARWGFPSPGTSGREARSDLINARAETVHEKPSFRGAFRSRRCIVPADGFYEWARIGNTKQPFWIRPAHEELLLLAGLYENPLHGGEASDAPRFTILTVPANDFMARIQPRMPLILPRSDADVWLHFLWESSHALPERLARCLAPAPEDALVSTKVSRYVNSPSHDDPKCIEPASEEETP